MRQFLFLFLVILCGGVLGGGCAADDEDSIIVDVWPIVLYFDVVDKESGESLLTSADSMRVLPMSVSFEGMTYGYGERQSGSYTTGGNRQFYAVMHGVTPTDLEDGRHVLSFGDISGDETFDKEPIVISWADGSTDVIELSNSLEDGYDHIKRSFRLNDEDYYSTVFEFRK